MIDQFENVKRFKYHFFWGMPQQIIYKTETNKGFFAVASTEHGDFELYWAVDDFNYLRDAIKTAQKSIPHFRFRVAAPLKELEILQKRVQDWGFPQKSFHVGLRLNHLNQLPIQHQPTIVSATVQDVSNLMKLEQTIFDSMNLSEQEWKQWLSDDSQLCFVYNINGLPAGFILLEFNFSQGFIRNLGVYENYRGKGIGEALLLEGLFNLKIEGVTRVMLWVEADNIPAICLYKKHGFIQDENEAEIVFEV